MEQSGSRYKAYLPALRWGAVTVALILVCIAAWSLYDILLSRQAMKRLASDISREAKIGGAWLPAKRALESLGYRSVYNGEPRGELIYAFLVPGAHSRALRWWETFRGTGPFGGFHLPVLGQQYPRVYINTSGTITRVVTDKSGDVVRVYGLE